MSHHAQCAGLCVVVALCGVCAGPVHALVLKRTGTLEPGGGRSLPYTVEADRIEGQREVYLRAEGTVRVNRGDERVEADWMRYDVPTDELTAGDRVIYTRGRDRIEGERLRLRLDERIGRAERVRYALYDETGRLGRGEADSVHFQGRDRYRLEQASYTTCPLGQDDWLLASRELELDYTRGLGRARHVTLRYLDTPILYTPWIDFSLDDRRKSGFLSPSLGLSDQRGLELATPWYWNIAPERDATLYPRFMSRRGLQLGAEYRYLGRTYQGDAGVEFLPDDNVADRHRWRGLISHVHSFSPRWFGSLQYERVSDDRYFADLSSQVRETSRVNLLQEGVLRYSGDGWQATGRLQSFQTLQDPAAPITPPYRRLPQLLLTGGTALAGDLPLQFDLAAESVLFEHPRSDRAIGWRHDLMPRLSLPLTRTYGFLTPRLAWRYTHYDLDRNPDPNYPALPLGPTRQTRSLPILSVDGGLFLEREARHFGRDFLQTLEPRAFYVHIPYRDQSRLPVFDTALRDLSLDQLFSENQYSGADRVNDARQLTLALTTRFLDGPSGVERLQATLGQRFYFGDQRVTLPGQTPRGGDSSDLLLQVSGQITDRWRLSGSLQFNADAGETVKANLGGAYRAGPGRLLNVDYRYINDRYAAGLDQLDLSWQWPVQPRWHGLGRINYSFRESRLVEGLVGFEYNAGCWILRGVAQRIAITQENATNAFYLQLELRGLTALGPNPLDVLRRSISGYLKSDEIDPY
ncbi:MAG: LPS-assembly protein LptD [Thiobacillaceae bacterium]|nr:LPS-assembly protein LptD [Thiobacillaceae bacterium]